MCPQCFTGLPLEPPSQYLLCPNEACGLSLNEDLLSYFFTIPIADQLKIIIKSKDYIYTCNYNTRKDYNYPSYPCRYMIGPGVYESIIQKKGATSSPGVISDICDGQLYRSLEYGNGPLSNDKSISVTLNTDGVSAFKSNKHCIWPILMMINEMPFINRYVVYLHREVFQL